MPHTLASVLYFSQQFVTMSNLQAIPQMFSERALFYRERAAGYYSETPYLLARCATNATLQVVFTLLYSVIVYPMVGLRGGVFSEYFVFFYLVVFGLSLAGYAFSNFIASITPNQQSALNLYSSFFQFFMFFCGYSIPVHQTPWGWRWATQVSFARWSFESLVLNQFAGEDDDDGAGGQYWLHYWGFRDSTKWCASPPSPVSLVRRCGSSLRCCSLLSSSSPSSRRGEKKHREGSATLPDSLARLISSSTVAPPPSSPCTVSARYTYTMFILCVTAFHVLALVMMKYVSFDKR